MKKVLLSKVFGNNIFTRSSMAHFFEKLKSSEIELDFSGVDFISRSCADEYIKKKNASKKEIIEVNMSDNISSMFDVVRKQYIKRDSPIVFEISSDKSPDHILIN